MSACMESRGGPLISKHLLVPTAVAHLDEQSITAGVTRFVADVANGTVGPRRGIFDPGADARSATCRAT